MVVVTDTVKGGAGLEYVLENNSVFWCYVLTTQMSTMPQLYGLSFELCKSHKCLKCQANVHHRVRSPSCLALKSSQNLETLEF